jgi:uncharacterized protein (UPF0371 family)
MGVNKAGFAILDEHALYEASKAEIISREARYRRDVSPVDPDLAAKCIQKCKELLVTIDKPKENSIE